MTTLGSSILAGSGSCRSVTATVSFKSRFGVDLPGVWPTCCYVFGLCAIDTTGIAGVFLRGAWMSRPGSLLLWLSLESDPVRASISNSE